jgi:hypothetical protein
LSIRSSHVYTDVLRTLVRAFYTLPHFKSV